jgi:hypothetical protein
MPTATQVEKRTGAGSATANQQTAMTSASHAIQALAAGTEGTRSIRLEEAPAQGGAPGIFGDISREQITRDVRIGQFEKVGEGGAFITCSLAVTFTQVTHEKEVQLLHPAAALPLKFANVQVDSLLSAGVPASSS